MSLDGPRPAGSLDTPPGTRRLGRSRFAGEPINVLGNGVRMAWIGVVAALSVAAWACTVPAPDPERAVAPVPTLEATPEWVPAFPPRNLYVVDRTESSLAVVWDSITRATHYDVQRGDSKDGEYVIVATEVTTLGLVDEGLKPDSVYYYLVRACNHFGCTEFDDDPVAGLTESDGNVDVPAVPKDVRVVRMKIEVFPDRDEVTWTAVEGATYYEVFRAGNKLTAVSAPLTISSHTDLGRSLNLSFGTSYQVRACNKAGCSQLSQ